jgi:hypothetical protein
MKWKYFMILLNHGDFAKSLWFSEIKSILQNQIMSFLYFKIQAFSEF